MQVLTLRMYLLTARSSEMGDACRVSDACIAVSQQQERQAANEIEQAARDPVKQRNSFPAPSKRPAEVSELQQSNLSEILQGQRRDSRSLQSPQGRNMCLSHDRLDSLEALLASLAVLDMSAFLHLLKQR